MLKRLQSDKGQAVVEMLPSFFLFIMIFTASLALFEVMSNAVKVQEAARNMAFAKIANSGSLITPPEEGPGLVLGRAPASRATVVPSGANAAISSGNNCFSVFPTEAAYSVDFLPIYGIASTLSLDFSTRISVYRNPGSSCDGR
ncbi:hypothetical protein GW915_08915 [bacterium]|nr:hypothetical protein [bacterium]